MLSCPLGNEGQGIHFSFLLRRIPYSCSDKWKRNCSASPFLLLRDLFHKRTITGLQSNPPYCICLTMQYPFVVAFLKCQITCQLLCLIVTFSPLLIYKVFVFSAHRRNCISDVPVTREYREPRQDGKA